MGKSQKIRIEEVFIATVPDGHQISGLQLLAKMIVRQYVRERAHPGGDLPGQEYIDEQIAEDGND